MKSDTEISPVPAPPYSVIATGYDVIMQHVDYLDWAEYTHELIQHTLPGARRLLELGCGTGTFGILLQALGKYDYTGTDIAEDMVALARQKSKAAGINITWDIADFTRFTVDEPYEVIILLYDGLNYVLEEEALRNLFRCVHKALKPGGIFFFDQSTPANSINNAEFFQDEGESGAFSYVRKSSYDESTHMHTTTFDINVNGSVFHEKHVQRAYTPSEIGDLVREEGFKVLRTLDGFSEESAHEDSERVHWIVTSAEAG